jgi:hypothetical protein
MSKSNGNHKSLATSTGFVDRFPALTNQEIINNLAEGEKLSLADLTKVTVPTGGGLAWTVEKLNGQESIKELIGIILSQALPRSLYASTFEESGGQEPAICLSNDSITGHLNSEALPNGEFPEKLVKIGNPTGHCESCPFAQWGTKLKADGNFVRGQMCQQRRVLLFLTPETSMPLLVSIPAGGLKNAKRYLVGLQAVGLKQWQIITNIGLMSDKNAEGIKFSRPTFSPVELIPKENWEQITTYIGSLKSQLAD